MAVRRNASSAAPDASEYAAPAEPPQAADPDDDLTPEDEVESERSSSPVKRGWGAANEQMARGAAYAEEWKPTDDETLVKFMEDEPFASVGSHWVDEITKGKRSFYCREDDCPLCGVGHKAAPLVFFNIALIGEGKPEVRALVAGPLLTKLIKENNEGRYGPLSRHYWLIKKSGGKKTNYNMAAVKASGLADDFELDPEAIAASLEGLQLYGPDIIKVQSRSSLQEIVDEHLIDD